MRMRMLVRALLGAALMFGTTAAAEMTDADFEQLADLYRHLHRHPELSFQETASAARMGQELRALGFEVTTGFGGTGVVAVLNNGDGPTVLVRADMDALPVLEQTGLDYASTARGMSVDGEEKPVMHACGHDIHMTTLIGTAAQLSRRTSEWRGTLIMIAQPAEERGAGAKAMIDAGLFTQFPRPDFNLALHVSASMPAGTIGYVAGPALANVDSVDITVRGVGGHGAYPHATKDPVVLAAQIVMALQTIVSREVSALAPAVVTVGSIHGGTKHNVIPDEVKLQLTLRSYTSEVREQIIAAIERITANLGRAAGLGEDRLPVVTVKDEYTPVAYNHPALTERVMAVFRREFGDERVIATSPVMGGEDFGRYGQVEPKIPSLIYWLGAVSADAYAASQAGGEPLPSLHSAYFAPDYAPTIRTGVTAMTNAVFDLLGR